MAGIMAEVAGEGMLGTEPPVDIDERAAQFAETIEGEGPGAFWVLEDSGRILGFAGVLARVAGVVLLAMAILPEARGRGGGRSLVQTAEVTPGRPARTSWSSRSGPTTPARLRYTPPRDSRSRGCAATTTAAATARSAAR